MVYEADQLDSEQLLYIYRKMVTIREFEEAAGRLAEQARIPGAVHLYAGEEAVAVGVCAVRRRVRLGGQDVEALDAFDEVVAARTL